MNKIFSFFLLFFAVFFTQAQVQFEVKVSGNQISPDDVIEVHFITNVSATNITLPNFEDFQIVGGPNQFHNRSYINGKLSTEVGISYLLQPKKEGMLTIGAAQLNYKGTLYKTKSVRIEVNQNFQNRNRNQSRNQNQQRYNQHMQQMLQQMQQMQQRHQQMIDEMLYGRQRQQVKIPADAGKGIHIETKISKKSAFVNEPVFIEYILHVSYWSSASDIVFENAPVFPNFWNYTEENKNPQIEERVFKGKKYRSVVLKKAVIMPQKSGIIEIPAVKMRMLREDFTGDFDVFGQPIMNRKNEVLASDIIKFQAKPLPQKEQPVDFLGAVGDFKISKTIDRKMGKAGEPFTVNVILQGKGNLDLIQLPKLEGDEHLEIYEPKITDNFNKNINSGLEGTRTYTYTVIPTYKGKYTLKPISFTYFDLASETYKTITTNPIVLDIPEGEEVPEDIEAEEELITGIQPLKKQLNLSKGDLGWANNQWYDWAFFLPLLLIPISVVQKNVSFKRNKLSKVGDNKLAKKYFADAKALSSEPKDFYLAIEKGLYAYLKGKLNIEIKDMTSENIRDLLLDKKVDYEVVLQFIRIKENCEMMRYSTINKNDVEDDYHTIIKTIQNLDQQLKKK